MTFNTNTITTPNGKTYNQVTDEGCYLEVVVDNDYLDDFEGVEFNSYLTESEIEELFTSETCKEDAKQLSSFKLPLLISITSTDDNQILMEDTEVLKCFGLPWTLVEKEFVWINGTIVPDNQPTKDYTHLEGWTLQKDYLDKLSDEKKIELYDNLADDSYPELNMDNEDSDKVKFITEEFNDYHYENPCQDVTFVATITLKDEVSKEVWNQLEEENENSMIYSLNWLTKEVKFLPDLDPMYFSKEAILCDFVDYGWIDFSLIKYFEIGDG
jgi:hypothetical protein